jgi:hypothetical protein
MGKGVEDELGVGVVQGDDQIGERVAGVATGQFGRQSQDACLAARERVLPGEVDDRRPVNPGDRLGAVVVVLDAGGPEVGPAEQAPVPADELDGRLIDVEAGGRGPQQSCELVGG